MSTSASRPMRLAWMLLGGAACFLAVTPPPASARPPQSQSRQAERVADSVGNFFFRAARKLENPVPNPEARIVRNARIYTVTTTPDNDEDVQVQRSRAPGRSGTENSSVRVWDPATRQWLPPSMVPRNRTYSSPNGVAYAVPSGTVTVTSVQPSMPSIRLQSRPGGSAPVIAERDLNAMRQPSDTRYLDPYGREATEAYGSTMQRREEPVLDTDTAAATTTSTTTTEQPATSARPPAPKPAAPQTPAEYGTRVPGKPGFVYPPGTEQDTKNMLDVRGLSAGQKVRDPRTGQLFLVP